MPMRQTVVLGEPWDVDRRLAEMGLDRVKLLRARDMAMNATANATPFHPANAAGTFGYHEGTWAVRNEFVDSEDWVVDRTDGIEAIRNDRLGLRIAYSNVDVACNDDHVPQPRTKKGSGAERASQAPLFPGLPTYAPETANSRAALYYLMVDVDGAVELTRPTIRGGRFSDPVERIYLRDDSDPAPRKGVDDDTGPVDIFDPQVARK